MPRSKLASLIKNAQRSEKIPIGTQFVNDIIRMIERSDEPRKPSTAYKPSSLGGCMRNIYYQAMGEETDGIPRDFANIGITETGSDRHERLQTIIAGMSANGFQCKYLDITEWLKANPVPGTKALEKRGIETKCFNETLNISFMTDGVIEYRGKNYVLEIKTESVHKFDKHDDPYPNHVTQAVAYAVCLGLDDIMFLYESRDNCQKKCYHVQVSPHMKEEFVARIHECDEMVASKELPEKSKVRGACTYCSYRKACRRDGE